MVLAVYLFDYSIAVLAYDFFDGGGLVFSFFEAGPNGFHTAGVVQFGKEKRPMNFLLFVRIIISQFLLKLFSSFFCIRHGPMFAVAADADVLDAGDLNGVIDVIQVVIDVVAVFGTDERIDLVDTDYPALIGQSL